MPAFVLQQQLHIWDRTCCSQSLKYLLAGPLQRKLTPVSDYAEGDGPNLLPSCFSYRERQGMNEVEVPDE